MDENIVLFKSKVHLDIEFNIFKILVKVGYDVKKAEQMAKEYVMTLRTSSFTKANTYEINIVANKENGTVQLIAPGFGLRNRKDIVLDIRELKYQSRWWWLFTTYHIVKSHC